MGVGMSYDWGDQQAFVNHLLEGLRGLGPDYEFLVGGTAGELIEAIEQGTEYGRGYVEAAAYTEARLAAR